MHMPVLLPIASGFAQLEPPGCSTHWVVADQAQHGASRRKPVVRRAVRLYDRRMAGCAMGSRATYSPHRTSWLACFMPTHFKGSLLSGATRPFGASPRSATCPHLTPHKPSLLPTRPCLVQGTQLLCLSCMLWFLARQSCHARTPLEQ